MPFFNMSKIRKLKKSSYYLLVFISGFFISSSVITLLMVKWSYFKI